METPYHKLEALFKQVHYLRGAAGILHWDMAVMMPSGGAEERGEQLATLESSCHQLLTSQEASYLLDEAEITQHDLDPWQRANLREMRHQWKHTNAVDDQLMQSFIRTGTECEQIWRTARKDNNFKMLLPHLEKTIQLTREIAQCKADIFECTPYNAMLDLYDPGRTTDEVDTVFTQLKDFLPSFVDSVLISQQSALPITGHFPIDKQKALGIECMEAIGFDFNHGRLDISHHPFCGGVASDVRITTRYDEQDFTSALMGVLHETGHAMYELGLPKTWRGQPVGLDRGMAFHESQSLLMEMQVCRSPAFFTWALPKMQKHFGVSGPEWELDNIVRHYNKVERSLIRVDADEVTYPLHVILRYELEQALLSGDLPVADLPGAWNEKMQSYLGIAPDSDANGCMQDIHWMDGSLGYFPTYTLGAIIAAQLFASIQKAIPDIHSQIEQGNFAPLIDWLRKNVHSQGCLYTSNELLEHATGQPLNVEGFTTHLKERYG